MLILITCSFLAIVTLAVIYAVGEKPLSSVGKNVVEDLVDTMNEITSSSNALVYSDHMQGVITKIDTTEKKVSLLDISNGVEHEYRYSGGTYFLDKYDQIIAAPQLTEGLIVDAYYIEDENKLAKLQVSKDAWESIGVTGVIINEEKGILSYNGQRYPLLKNAVVLDKSQPISLSNILTMDYVTLRGTKDNVCVISLTKGHGYLELAGEEKYIGGILYIGTEVITQIEENMRIPVREGNYSITVVNGDLSGTKELTIEKNKTTLFDVSEYGESDTEKGLVHFKINPKDAILYIDGVKKDHSQPIELSYGEHMLEVSLGGYVTYNGTIVVNSADRIFNINLPDNTNGNTENNSDNDSNIDSNNGSNTDNNNTGSGLGNDSNSDSNNDLDDDATDESNDLNGSDLDSDDNDTEDGEDLEDNDAEEDNSNQDNSDSEEENEDEEPTIGGVDESKTLTISCTEGTLVYIDGSYIGKIKNGKLVTKKYTGYHTIKLVLDGYSNKTYNIDLEDDGENAVLKFPAFS